MPRASAPRRAPSREAKGRRRRRELWELRFHVASRAAAAVAAASVTTTTSQPNTMPVSKRKYNGLDAIVLDDGTSEVIGHTIYAAHAAS